jgi:hypothetical protein
VVLSAPKRLNVSWPRYYCPQCGVELRSSSRSLLPSFLLFIVGLVALLATSRLSAPFAGVVQVLGSAALGVSLLLAYWLHKWEVVRDQSA